MPAFLDTSALIKHFVDESGSEVIRRLIASGTPLWVSELAVIEGVSTLAKKVRTTEITERDFRSLQRALLLFLGSGRCVIIPFDEQGKNWALGILSNWALKRSLKSLDVLQLAAAVRARQGIGQMEFYSGDRDLLPAAEMQGFITVNPR